MDSVRKNKLAILLFIFPAALLFTAIIILPIFMSSYYSVLKWDGINNGVFVGLKNYIDLFTSKSAGFPKTIGNALMLAFLSALYSCPYPWD